MMLLSSKKSLNKLPFNLASVSVLGKLAKLFEPNKLGPHVTFKLSQFSLALIKYKLTKAKIMYRNLILN